MATRSVHHLLPRLELSVILPALAGLATAAAAQEKITFDDHIKPIFVARCLNCHNPDKLKGDLDLTSFRATMAGSSGGEVVKSGDPAGSSLLGVVSHTQEPKMPPKGDKIA
ncbi:MAG: hypothetical protein NTV94_04200, partial [Planctomycetota bacterium]|nr:hypothetical protein [Planctomycetota bacterium]